MKPESKAAAVGAGPAIRPVPFRGQGFRVRRHRFLGAATFVALLLAWEVGSRTGVISNVALPAPSEAVAALVDLVRTGLLWKHLGASLTRLVVGWGIGSTLGVLFGLAVGLFSVVRAGALPLVTAFLAIPKIALLPLFVVWFGIGEGSKIATIAFGTFFPTVIATYGGVDSVDKSLIRMGQAFGLTWLSIVRKIIVPGALPAILSGFRISIAIAIVLLVAAEMLGAEFGLGAYILTAGSLFATDRLVAGVAVLAGFGLSISWLIGLAERRFLAWRS